MLAAVVLIIYYT